MKPRPPRQFLQSLQRRSTGLHLRIAVLNKSNSQMVLKLFERLFRIIDPKYLMELALCLYQELRHQIDNKHYSCRLQH